MIRKDEYPRYTQLLRQRPEFSGFTAAQFEVLEDHLQVKRFPKGQLIFDQADPRARFYFVISGLLGSERVDETGDFVFYSFINKNKGFPYRGLFHDDDYAYSVRCLTAVEVVSVPMSDFESLLVANPEMLRRVVQEMGQIINETEDQLQQMVTSSASNRVRNALRIIGQQLGEELTDGRLFVPYPITLIELSQVAGTTRETASQTVQRLIKAGTLVYEHKNFTVSPDM